MGDLLGKTICKAYSSLPENSLYEMTGRGGSHRVSKEITLSANNTSATVNIFQITGSICIDAIFGEVTDATTLVNCTACQLTAYDGTNTVNLTANGAALSGYGVGTFVIKDQEAAQDLNVSDNSQVRLVELTGKKPHQPFILTQKISTATYIRFGYATTDAPINAKIMFYVCYHNINGGTIVAV